MKLRIEKAIYGGDGLARIPRTSRIRREDCLCSWYVARRIGGSQHRRERRSFATGELEAILEPSPERVVPGCEYVPRCGGCQYQHANAAFQLQMKLDILKETLARAHVPVPGEIGEPGRAGWGYRNRIRLHVMNGPIALGYRQRGSHDLLPVTHCPIAAPLLEQAIAAVHALAQRPASRAFARKWNSLPTASRTSCSSPSGPAAATHRAGARAGPGSVRRTTARAASVLTGVGLFRQGGMTYWGSALSPIRSPELPGEPRRLLSGQSLSAAGSAAPGDGDSDRAGAWPGISTPAPGFLRGRSILKT